MTKLKSGSWPKTGGGAQAWAVCLGASLCCGAKQLLLVWQVLWHPTNKSTAACAASAIYQIGACEGLSDRCVICGALEFTSTCLVALSPSAHYTTPAGSVLGVRHALRPDTECRLTLWQ